MKPFIFFKTVSSSLLLILGTLSSHAQQDGYPSTEQCCLPPTTNVGVYNFVPEAALQAGDFRPLMKSETAFIHTLMDVTALDVEDFTTAIPSAEVMPDPPHLTEELDPPPAQSHTTDFVVGTITQSGTGFLLKTLLKKSTDSTLLKEVSTPFATAADAETAGKTAANTILQFLTSQAQTARDHSETSDHAIDPHIILVIPKLRLKPNETSPVKVILTDCDGQRLKHRTIEAFLQLTHGGTPVQEETLERVTDDNGERNGVIGAKAPGIINYIVKFKYHDIMGVQREVSDTKTIVIIGDEPDQWQMRVDMLFERSSRAVHPEAISGTWSGERYYLHKKASVVFMFKAVTDPSGDVATDQYTNFNGFGEVSFRRKNIDHGESAEVRNASGEFDHSQEGTELLQAGFNISPSNNEFQASVGGVHFRGSLELFAVRKHPYNYVHRFEEYIESMGVGGGEKITPQMTQSGTYTFTKTTKLPLTDAKGETSGNELNTFTVEIRKLGGSGDG